ncbi:primosomal protein N' [Solemya pervernicosa gill symbiont]|uniref:Replication restart protein PriA n=2 Tax=Gammaproteobacteria incertae sedis TaxID=118884 RepID=A0A1T2LB10_9GAMM|nr:primosomal protein N' [Candidatus Reidiella endopervernicosa]OOZ42271.1 primosomal protein N' [Solemya pervernicosa gill symbiont]QKQ25668.1 primosomal protein N' [Candidatus Reidiella endopervernicosa]
MSDPAVILRIAVPTPLYRLFDYLPPKDCDTTQLQPGLRLQIPFGRTKVVGLLVEVSDESEFELKRLRRAYHLLDQEPLFDTTLLKLLVWSAHYYHHPIGEALATALPVLLRQGHAAEVRGEQQWQITDAGLNKDPLELKRAPRQATLLNRLKAHPEGVTSEALSDLEGDWRGALRALINKGLVEVNERPCLEAADSSATALIDLNSLQQQAVDAVLDAGSGFNAWLLEGVTGSGKTEVYLHMIRAVIDRGEQVLVLIPEIGLTPQLVERFRRLGVALAVLHSGLSNRERLCAWLAASSGTAPVVIGTRSALFTPLARPGLIVVDEEHDLSYKQQDGFRYHARDLAVLRARHHKIPIVLGTATPSLESLHNLNQQRYKRLHLPERVGNAIHPKLRLLDVRSLPMEDGLSPPLLESIRHHLDKGGQVLLFLNRRGFAPTLFCHDCGWIADCPRCDHHYTLHQRAVALRCHHCDTHRPLPEQCPDCGSPDLRPLGLGTERIETALSSHFPEVGHVRIDRDTTRNKGAMEEKLALAHSGEARILIGTQMLAKGHHLPDVTLVAILDIDQALYGADFRATERMAQLVVQVAGRAGRAERPGEVVIQTHHPENPLLNSLLTDGYARFAEAALAERNLADLPPNCRYALLRADATDSQAPFTFLERARELGSAYGINEVMLLGPIPAPMPRRAGRYRAQLLLQASDRAPLQQLLTGLIPQLESEKSARKVRWSIDIDPMEIF